MDLMGKIKQVRNDREIGIGYKTVANYLGGHPAYVKQIPGNLVTKPEGLVFNAMFKDRFTISYKEITAVESDTAEHLTLGRMLLVGVFSLAWKKKDKFLKVSYKDNTGFQNEVVFGKLNADEWKGIISRARYNAMQNN